MAFTPLKQFKETLDNIKQYVSIISTLAKTRWVLNDIRVTPTGTVTVAWSITNVNTIANQTAIWGLQASLQVKDLTNISARGAYNNLIRS